MSTVFIVSTGRCGSTFISRILNAHPDVLSLNELYSMLIGRAFPPGALDGSEFWHLLSEPNKDVENLLGKGARIPEILYPYQSGRFNLRTGVPPLLYCTLPLLTDDPDSLYLELAPVVPRWPRRPVGAHYQQLFRWLADRFTRSIVVERSGQSVNWIPQLRVLFPDARFVHLYRNGPDCALSMSRHAGFQVLILLVEAARILGVSPWAARISDEQARQLPDRLARVVLGDFDLQTLDSSSIPIRAFGELWSAQTCAGVAELSKLPATARMSISYDLLLSDPVPQLVRLADFIGAEQIPGWLENATSKLDPTRAGAARRLDPVTLTQLNEACAAGTNALRAAGMAPIA